MPRSPYRALVICLSIGLAGAACSDDENPGGGGSGGAGGGGPSGGGPSGGSGGSGGGPVSMCGDGQIDAGEECDEGAATAGCDADCTAVSCGDGSHNLAAGEGCDDGNTAEGDACGATCTPTVVVLTPSFPSSTSDAVAVAATGDRFGVVWVVNSASSTSLTYATLGVAGVSAQTELATGDVGSVSIGSDAAGRGMIIASTSQGMSFDLAWRFVAPGGALEPEQGSAPGTFFAPAGNPVGKPYASAGGLFCALAANGDLRCGDDTSAFGPPTAVSPGAQVQSAHMLAREDRLLVSYIVEGTPYELRLLELDAAGAPIGVSMGLAGADANSYATGGVTRPDGTFGFALSAGGDVTWYPFHADGVFDATNVRDIATQAARAKLVAIPSGRFLLVWYEGGANQTCPLVGRLFDEDVEPLGDPIVLYDAPSGKCAARYDVAASPNGDVALAWLEYASGGTYGARALYLPGLIHD